MLNAFGPGLFFRPSNEHLANPHAFSAPSWNSFNSHFLTESLPSSSYSPHSQVHSTHPTRRAPMNPSASTASLFLLASVAATGGFLFGFDTAVINGAVLALKKHFNIGELATGLAVSLALLGSAAGALLAGGFADAIGRTRVMLYAALLFFISSIGSAFPFSIYDFTAWRLIGGIAVGAASVIAPTYIAEISPAHLRGRLGSLQQLAIVSGIFIALLSNYLIARLAGGASEPWLFGLQAWRWMFLIETIPAALYAIGSLLIPESPRHLVAKNRDQEAAQVLSNLIGGDCSAKITEIRNSLKSDTPPRPRDLLAPTGLLPIVWIGIVLSVLQQLVGINVIFYYSSMLWQSVGFTEDKALYVTMVTGAINILTTFVAIATVDRLGRKPLLIIGSLGMAISLSTMAYLFGNAQTDPLGNPALSPHQARAALVAANLYVIFFGMSWGPVVWVLLGEMFPNRIRAIALSLAACLQWIANFAVSTSFPPMAAHWGLGISYLCYAIAATASILFVTLFIPETKGRELESM